MTSMGRRFSVAAALTLLWASATLAQRAITAGRRSIIALNKVRA